MQIVIDIPDDTTKLVEECIKFDNMIDLDVYDIVLNAIKNGKPVPEHRGRLIDADEMAMIITARFFNNIHYGAILKALWDSTTIIEADKEAEK